MKLIFGGLTKFYVKIRDVISVTLLDNKKNFYNITYIYISMKVKLRKAHFRVISRRLIAAACRTIPDGDVENVEGRLGGGPVDAINRIHCFPPGNRLEQWSRHVIRAIKPHQITTLRHRVSLRSCARALIRSLARSLARSAQSTKAYINVMRP